MNTTQLTNKYITLHNEVCRHVRNLLLAYQEGKTENDKGFHVFPKGLSGEEYYNGFANEYDIVGCSEGEIVILNEDEIQVHSVHDFDVPTLLYITQAVENWNCLT